MKQNTWWLLGGFELGVGATAVGAFATCLRHKEPVIASYDDCVLESLPGTPASTIRVVESACRSKFLG